MEAVMVTNQYGKREIQPESLWVGLTRYNRRTRSWQQVEREAYGNHEQTEAGMWIPSVDTSTRDYQRILDIAHTEDAGDYLLLPEQRLHHLQRTLGSVSIDSAGCWTNEGEASDADTRLIAEADTAHRVIESDEHFSDLRVCATHGCLYHRHYDFSSNVPSGRRELVYPNTEFFTDTGEQIITAWGDVLPSTEASRQSLVEFSRRCAPHVDRSQSLLTATGVSQINLIPDTGCWFVRSYYHTPTGEDSPRGWQWDGYGRLKIPKPLCKAYNTADFSTLAHRIVWALHDKELKDPKRWVLNHMCGFRPCANPNHLVQVAQDTNTMHGVSMEVARHMISGSIPVAQGLIDLQARAPMSGTSAEVCIDFWAQKQ